MSKPRFKVGKLSIWPVIPRECCAKVKINRHTCQLYLPKATEIYRKLVSGIVTEYSYVMFMFV